MTRFLIYMLAIGHISATVDNAAWFEGGLYTEQASVWCYIDGTTVNF
jgi:hypothetical protein